MDKNYQELISKLGGKVIKIDPQNTSKINPFEIVESRRSVKDMLDHRGEIKPFEDVSKETGITLEQYQQAEFIIRTMRGENPSRHHIE
ncbi:hypothetical protein A8L34_27825 [Bacillus sp. FJAT-27264]|uniref:hypothetical protein n=1 Tax=Paenibacillus sp. (strain DSM 101736 / FJAT-27264) TaxID=1850362 RepID=UPI000807C422|nr:hypothetical protein [Bacillus sp. FJAT-27264]OBZ15858.1 hypothetical protein A8L34_27825 [Bacillus sp. FJAT-27264]